MVFCVPKSALTVPAINISSLFCAKEITLMDITAIIKKIWIIGALSLQHAMQQKIAKYRILFIGQLIYRVFQ